LIDVIVIMFHMEEANSDQYVREQETAMEFRVSKSHIVRMEEKERYSPMIQPEKAVAHV
jgi:hypothetical protein